jgi:hypothetical protein
MEPISLILAALLAGVAKGAGQAATNAVQDAYTGLRDALKRRLAGKPAAQDAVDEYVKDPEAWRGNLEVHLKQAKADQDQAILDAAASVMRLADPAGKYNVNVTGSQGVQVGDRNEQHNVFNAPPASPAG